MSIFLSIGSGPGIGLATAEHFASQGFQIVLSARTATKTEALAQQLRDKGYKVDVKTVDATNPDAVASLIEDVETQIGPIDVVHYNAASMRQATVSDQPLDTFNTDLAINIGGALVAVQAASAKMSNRGAGTILLTGGGYALSPAPDYLSLSIGKAGIRALIQGVFEELKKKNIHVGSVVVKALILPGSREANDVAEQFWRLHSQEKVDWTTEVSYPV
ncbi:SDR family NAD(P)-dependent oxidoreductase [Agrobacterium sp. MOPV5]|uniref:SDR family NAD(P)-dependent oxidoreductase n=1 Tax=Agrobacterium leguminum TaxID=2792015 RepID=UPI0018C3042B|nr:SDR family NAD(P)-dependent oxidoreductase [Agrobacterium leguminum]MBG0511615.1 SDR family NAD(P)-dependent oxidoreductase [Agrobacterium leguminum]